MILRVAFSSCIRVLLCECSSLSSTSHATSDHTHDLEAKPELAIQHLPGSPQPSVERHVMVHRNATQGGCWVFFFQTLSYFSSYLLPYLALMVVFLAATLSYLVLKVILLASRLPTLSCPDGYLYLSPILPGPDNYFSGSLLIFFDSDGNLLSCFLPGPDSYLPSCLLSCLALMLSPQLPPTLPDPDVISPAAAYPAWP